MCILELFYKIEMIDSFASVEGQIYRYWSVDDDGRLILLQVREGINSDDIEAELTSEYFDHDYVSYEKLRPFLENELEIKGEIETFQPSFRDAFTAIRVTCGHDCCDITHNYEGYALRAIPSCDKNLVGTSLWSAKWSTLQNYMIDISYWISYCQSLDVYIHVFDYTPDENWNESFAYSWLGFQIQGKKVIIYTDKNEMRRMYEKYDKHYRVFDR